MKHAITTSENLQATDNFNRIMAMVEPLRFVRVPTDHGAAAAVVPRCAKKGCGRALTDPSMAIWSSLERRTESVFGEIVIRPFCRATCDVFGEHRALGLSSCWWSFSQLWQLDQRGPLEKPAMLPSPKRRRATRVA